MKKKKKKEKTVSGAKLFRFLAVYLKNRKTRILTGFLALG
jgi:hypothetical protein